MAVCAYHKRRGFYKTELGEQRVFDARFAHVVKMFYSLFFRKVADGLALFRAFDVLCRYEMVENEHDFVGTFNPFARSFHFFDGNGRGYVVAENDVDVCRDQFARSHAFASCVCGQYFLSGSHFHG